MISKKIAIVGAGPIGIEAALYALALGHDVRVFERGDVADSIGQWGFISMFSPWSMNTTPLGWTVLRRAEPDGKICPTGAELRDIYLKPLAESTALRGCISTRTQVVSIGREDDSNDQPPAPFRLLVRDPAGNERTEIADVVLDCSGVYLHHRWAGRGGIPAPGEQAAEPRIWYQLPDVLGKDRARFLGKHTLVMGAGYSAATTLHAIGILNRENPNTKASWAIRRIGQALQAIHDDALPARASLVKTSLQLANDPPPWLQYLGNCVLEKIEAEKQLAVTLRYMETDLLLVVDEVVALVGYATDTAIYQSHEGQEYTNGQAKDQYLNPQPGLYILGAKSFGTNSNFLIQIGHQQVKAAFAAIQGDPRLDLYMR